MVLTRMGNYIYSNMSFLLFYVYHSYAHWISKTYKSPTESPFSPPLPVYMFFFRSRVLPFIHEIMILRVRRMPTTIIFTIPGGDAMREFNWRKTLQLHLNEGSTNKFYIWSSISSSSCAPNISLAISGVATNMDNYSKLHRARSAASDQIRKEDKINLQLKSFFLYLLRKINKETDPTSDQRIHSFIYLLISLSFWSN